MGVFGGVVVLFIQSSKKCQRLSSALVLASLLIMSAGMLRSHFHIDLEGRSDVSTDPNWAGQLHFLIVDLVFVVLSGACGYAVVTYSCTEPVVNVPIPKSSWLHLRSFKNSVDTMCNMIITNLNSWITAGFYLYIYVQMYNPEAAGTPEHMSDTDVFFEWQVSQPKVPQVMTRHSAHIEGHPTCTLPLTCH